MAVRQRGRRTAVRERSDVLPKLAVILLAVALVLGGVLMLKLAERRGAELEEDPQELVDHRSANTVTVGGQQVVIDESLPQSELESEHFTTHRDGTITYSGPARYGIDVSSHQGEIDWQAVAADGVEFAMLRIGYRGYSEGALNLDKQFATNYTGATENGIDVGVYFFSQAVDEVEALIEAQQVIQWLEDRKIDCPVVFDWEHITYEEARTDEVEGEMVTSCARIFCQEIESAGYTPMVYCNGMLGYLGYDLNQLTDIDIWFAEYNSDYPSYAYETAMWQYTDSGKVSGIQGNVDRNIWFLPGE